MPSTRNWLELPSDITMNILQRIGVIDILLNAQRVCTYWRGICKDPALWRVIFIDGSISERVRCPPILVFREMYKHAVDRSQSQLVDFRTRAIGYRCLDILQYVADRSSQLRRLEINYGRFNIRSEVFNKLPFLEELSFVTTLIELESIEAAGRCCPLLKTLKVEREWWYVYDEISLAIAKYLPQLTHLQLVESGITNVGLEAILDGCCRLESLDLRQCRYLFLKGNLGKRCSQQIKHLKILA